MNLKKTMLFVMLLACFLAFAQTPAITFFNAKINDVKALVTLSTQQEQKLFSVYQSICNDYPDQGQEKAFVKAIGKVVVDSAKIAKIYSQEIAKVESPIIHSLVAKEKASHNLTNEQETTVKLIISQYRFAKRLLNYRYPGNTEKIESANENQYAFFTKKLAFAYNSMNVKNVLTPYSDVLKYIKELSLSTTQINAVSENAWKHYEQKQRGVNTGYFRQKEYEELKTLLNADQLTNYLQCKALVIARNDATNVWREVKAGNLASAKDSTATSSILIPFFQQKALLTLQQQMGLASEIDTKEKLTQLSSKNPEILLQLNASKADKSYLDTKLKELNTCIKLSDTKIQALRDSYNQLRAEDKLGQSGKKHYEIAVVRVIADTAQIKRIFKNDIECIYAESVNKKVMELMERYKLTEVQRTAIESIVKAYRRADLESSYLYPEDVEKLKEVKLQLLNNYQKQLLGALTRMQVNNDFMEKATALKYTKELSVTPSQTDSLIEFAWRIRTTPAKEPAGSKLRTLEFCTTKKILSPGQFDYWLRLKVKTNAQKQTDAAWAEIKKFNLDAELDSASTMRTLNGYYTQKLVIQEKMNNPEANPTEKSASQQQIASQYPYALRKLDALKRRDAKQKALTTNTLAW